MSECPYSFSDGEECVLPANQSGLCSMPGRASECRLLLFYGPQIEAIAAPLRVRVADVVKKLNQSERHNRVLRGRAVHARKMQQLAEARAEAAEKRLSDYERYGTLPPYTPDGKPVLCPTCGMPAMWTHPTVFASLCVRNEDYHEVRRECEAAEARVAELEAELAEKGGNVE